MVNYIPERGDIVWLSFHPVRGHEEKGRRPAIVLSPKRYNSRAGLALVCPITSKVKGYPFEVALVDGKILGVILADQLRAVDWRARKASYIAAATESVSNEVRDKLLTLLT